MARVDHNRQMGMHFHQRHSRDIQVVADHRLKGSDAALTEDHIFVAARVNIFSRHQEFLHGCGKAAFQQNWLFGTPQLLEQHKVLHIARAQLDDIDIGKQIQVLFAHDFGDNRQSGLPLGFQQQPEAFGFHPLEGIRGGARLERASAQEGRPRLFDRFGNHQDLIFALHRARPGEHIKIALANLSPGDFKHSIGRMHLAVDRLIRLGDTADIFHRTVRKQRALIDTGGIAQQAKDCGR